ncbi:hypothetical protein [Polaromonas sp.]|uniref:hypothetical protein n=1 Tax=Polaromonas sp. TaxID=1869339 RepID=UPI002488D2B4|nr:hypothetical protein [Polaromonas sp.]MDI1339364.1 hypothetical protein [Polaromonas sp.]
MSYTIRIHYKLQGEVPTVPGSMNQRTAGDDGDFKLISTESKRDFDEWEKHLKAAKHPYSVVNG